MIRKLWVRNFRSLREVEVSLGLRNVFVGPNMAGKSNLIDVFRFLSRMVLPAGGTYGLPNAFHSMGGFPEIVWKGGDSNLIAIALEGDTTAAHKKGTHPDWHYELQVLADSRGWLRVQEESLEIFEGGEKYSLIGNRDGRRYLLNRDGRNLSEVSGSDRSALEFEIPDWDGNTLRQYFSSFRFYHLLPPVMTGVNQAVAANFLNEHGDNFSSWLMTLQTSHGDHFQRIARVAQAAFPELEGLFTLPTQQGTVLVASREKHLKRPVAAWQMSDGEITFIALLSLIFSPPPLGAPLFCVEEPENNLHPRLLDTLVEVLKQVQAELPEGDRSQLLVTTHSPHLVDKFDLGELIVVEKRDGATVCSRPADKAHLRGMLEREEIGLGHLYYSGALRSE